MADTVLEFLSRRGSKTHIMIYTEGLKMSSGAVTAPRRKNGLYIWYQWKAAGIIF